MCYKSSDKEIETTMTISHDLKYSNVGCTPVQNSPNWNIGTLFCNQSHCYWWLVTACCFRFATFCTLYKDCVHPCVFRLTAAGTVLIGKRFLKPKVWNLARISEIRVHYVTLTVFFVDFPVSFGSETLFFGLFTFQLGCLCILRKKYKVFDY